jgi:hypothetical protein
VLLVFRPGLRHQIEMDGGDRFAAGGPVGYQLIVQAAVLAIAAVLIYQRAFDLDGQSAVETESPVGFQNSATGSDLGFMRLARIR